MNMVGSVLLDTNVVIANFRNDPDLTARLRAAPAIYLSWVVFWANFTMARCAPSGAKHN
jgi:predicted nucleic acid-binding protein